MFRILSFLFLLTLTTGCSQKSIRDMSCPERCQHDYNSTFNQLEINDDLGYTPKRVDSWEADKRRQNCLQRYQMLKSQD